MKSYKVLLIDAWADHEDEEGNISYSWNNWFPQSERYRESSYGPLNDKSAMTFFREFYIKAGFEDHFEIEDDEYNLILVRRSDRCPVFAIEYGNDEEEA